MAVYIHKTLTADMRTDSTYLKKMAAEHQYFDDITDPSINRPTVDFTWDLQDFDWSIRHEVMWAVVIILLVLLLWWLVRSYIKREHEADDEEQHAMGDDTIFGHQWDVEEERLVAEGKYGEVAVLLYLRHLAELHDSKVIVFHVSKTPNMFTDELNTYCKRHGDGTGFDPIKEKNRKLTSLYLLARYGHREITAETIQQIKTL